MARVTITRIGKSPKQIMIEAEKASKRLKVESEKIGMETAQEIRNIIEQNTKRPGSTGKLRDSVDFEPLPDGWGVGNIAKMNSQVPYWRAQNYGSSHIVGLKLPKGGFTPGEAKPNSDSFRAGRWQTGAGEFHAKIKKPIPAMNYVQKGINWCITRFERLAAKVRRI